MANLTSAQERFDGSSSMTWALWQVELLRCGKSRDYRNLTYFASETSNNWMLGRVIFKSGYPVGVFFKGCEIFGGKFKGYEIFPENHKGSENFPVPRRIRGAKI